MLRSLPRFVTVAVIVGALVGLLAPTAHANASKLQFGRIQYDTPGADTPVTNAKLVAEYVVVKNLGTVAKSLKGFTVRDAQNHVYTFGTFTLGAGKAVLVHTGKGTNSATHRYWGLGNYVWNNGGDAARLRTPGGTEIDACGWTSVGAGYKICPT
jgi:hypothetical protein